MALSPVEGHVVDLIDNLELWRMYIDYATEVVTGDRVVPFEFGEWKRLVLQDDHAVKLTFGWSYEKACGGYLTGANYGQDVVRVPSYVVTDEGEVADVDALKRLAKKFLKTGHRKHWRLPAVFYNQSRIYHWTWS